MIYLTGDKHGEHDMHDLSSRKFPEGKELTKDDYVIILGDFGLLWHYSYNAEEEYFVNWLNSKPWTTLFIDGNHENFDLLDALPEVDMFGAKVGKFTDSIYHLKRGNIYTIEGINFFTFGGAQSIDKAGRVEGQTWWKREEPNFKEFKFGIDNLQRNDMKVDYVLTHDCPTEMTDYLLGEGKGTFYDKSKTYPLRKYFESLNYEYKLDYKHWYFGHYHVNDTHKKYTCLFDKVKRLN